MAKNRITTTGDRRVTSVADIRAQTGTFFDDVRQNIINGIDSAQAEATGWDAVVKTAIPLTSVVRTSDTVVTITLPAVGTYDITADETVTVTVPATALAGASAIVATPTFSVAAFVIAGVK